MLAGLAADALVVVHLAFIVFVVLGGLLVLRWPHAVWVHLPAMAWGAWVELAGWPCPLTPLEQALRERAGEGAYSGGFVEHYLLPLLYPEGWTPQLGVVLGLAVLAVNGLVYGVVMWRRRRRWRCTSRMR